MQFGLDGRQVGGIWSSAKNRGVLPREPRPQPTPPSPDYHWSPAEPTPQSTPPQPPPPQYSEPSADVYAQEAHHTATPPSPEPIHPATDQFYDQWYSSPTARYIVDRVNPNDGLTFEFKGEFSDAELADACGAGDYAITITEEDGDCWTIRYLIENHEAGPPYPPNQALSRIQQLQDQSLEENSGGLDDQGLILDDVHVGHPTVDGERLQEITDDEEGPSGEADAEDADEERKDGNDARMGQHEEDQIDEEKRPGEHSLGLIPDGVPVGQPTVQRDGLQETTAAKEGHSEEDSNIPQTDGENDAEDADEERISTRRDDGQDARMGQHEEDQVDEEKRPGEN